MHDQLGHFATEASFTVVYFCENGFNVNQRLHPSHLISSWCGLEINIWMP